MSHVLIYLHIVFMPCTWYANHALRVNITDSISVCLFFNIGRKTLEEVGKKKLEVMLKRNHEEYSFFGLENVCRLS